MRRWLLLALFLRRPKGLSRPNHDLAVRRPWTFVHAVPVRTTSQSKKRVTLGVHVRRPV
jgi:hypothetical protein